MSAPAAVHTCEKCGSPRTRPLGPASGAYFRCDACAYIFPIRHERATHTPSSTAAPQPAHECPKCRSTRVQTVGRSADPPLLHVRCDACGHVSSTGAA